MRLEVKFLTNPDKFIFIVALDVIVFLSLLALTVINWPTILCVLLLIWIFVAVQLARANLVRYTIEEHCFVVKHMGKTIKIDFEKIDHIEEFVYANNFNQRRYLLRLSSDIAMNSRVLKIQCSIFTKWLDEHRHLFNIKSQTIL